MNQEVIMSIGWVGLSFSAFICFLYLFWYTLGRYILKREMATKEKIEKKTDQSLLQKEGFKKSIQSSITSIKFLMDLTLAFFSLYLILISITDFPTYQEDFVLSALILSDIIIPVYFGAKVTIHIFNDTLKRMEELDQVK